MKSIDVLRIIKRIMYRRVNMFGERLIIIFAVEHYNPLGVLRSLGEKGIKPVFIAEKGKAPVSSASKYVGKCHFVDTVEEGYQVLLSEYGNYDQDNKPVILCTDDHVLGYLDSRYEELKDRFVLFNAGKTDGINEFIDKGRILELAEECGLNIAKTVICDRGVLPENVEYPIITKSISPNVGGWKSDVFICQNEKELEEAYTKIKAPKVLVQKYIDKKNELEYYGYSINHGQDVFISIGVDYLYLIPGYYSPYMNVFEPPYKEVQDKIAAMIKKIGFEGIFSVEFLRDDNDELYFLEINFRIATWCHSSTYVGMNLPYQWIESTLDGEIKKECYKPFKTFRAMVEPIDYGKRVDSGKITIAEWAKDFKETEFTYYYDSKDLEPYKVMCENWDKLK